jgi:hypothetical protein
MASSLQLQISFDDVMVGPQQKRRDPQEKKEC